MCRTGKCMERKQTRGRQGPQGGGWGINARADGLCFGGHLGLMRMFWNHREVVVAQHRACTKCPKIKVALFYGYKFKLVFFFFKKREEEHHHHFPLP